MKVLLYAGLILLVVPLQTALLHHVGLWGIKPDLGLIAVCLVGLLAGELDGVLMGLAMGWALDLFSAGELWLNLVTKGGAGLVAGLAGRQIAHITPVVLLVGLLVVSAVSGLITAFNMNVGGLEGLWWAVRSVVLPQACYDALVGAGVYWLALSRLDWHRFDMHQRI